MRATFLGVKIFRDNKVLGGSKNVGGRNLSNVNLVKMIGGKTNLGSTFLRGKTILRFKIFVGAKFLGDQIFGGSTISVVEFLYAIAYHAVMKTVTHSLTQSHTLLKSDISDI